MSTGGDSWTNATSITIGTEYTSDPSSNSAVAAAGADYPYWAMWWKFTPSEDGVVQLDSMQGTANDDTVIALYRGADEASKILVSGGDDIWDDGFSEVFASVQAGTEYHVALGQYSTTLQPMSLVLHTKFTPDTDIPWVTLDLATAELPGGTGTYDTTGTPAIKSATGTSWPDYRWPTLELDFENNLYYVFQVQHDLSRMTRTRNYNELDLYSQRTDNDEDASQWQTLGSTFSRSTSKLSEQLTILVGPDRYDYELAKLAGESHVLWESDPQCWVIGARYAVFPLTYVPPPPDVDGGANDMLVNATTVVVDNPSIPVSNTTFNLQNNDDEPTAGNGRTAWYVFTAPTAGTVVFDTLLTGSPTAIRVSQGPAGASSYAQLFSHTATYTGSTSSGVTEADPTRPARITRQVSAGTVYYIQVDSYGATVNADYVLSVSYVSQSTTSTTLGIEPSARFPPDIEESWDYSSGNWSSIPAKNYADILQARTTVNTATNSITLDQAGYVADLIARYGGTQADRFMYAKFDPVDGAPVPDVPVADITGFAVRVNYTYRCSAATTNRRPASGSWLTGFLYIHNEDRTDLYAPMISSPTGVPPTTNTSYSSAWHAPTWATSFTPAQRQAIVDAVAAGRVTWMPNPRFKTGTAADWIDYISNVTIDFRWDTYTAPATRTGQLYVNLSTEQNSPDWVSVCPGPEATQIQIHVNTPESGEGYTGVPYGGATVVGAANIVDAWMDDSDSSYMEIPPWAGANAGVNINLFDDLQDQGFNRIRVEIDAEAMGPGDAYYSWGFACDSEYDYPGANYFSFGWSFDPEPGTGDLDGVVRVPGNTRRLYTAEITSDYVYYQPQEWSVDRFLNRVNAYEGSYAGDPTPYHRTYGGLDNYHLTSSTLRIYSFRVLAYTDDSFGKKGHFNISETAAVPDWRQVHYNTGGSAGGFYWTDESTKVWCWDGAAITSLDTGASIGTLIDGPDRLVAALNPAGVTSAEVDYDLIAKTDWPAHAVDGTSVRRDWRQGIGVYDASRDCYWIQLDTDLFTLPNPPYNPIWGKFSASGDLVSLHCEGTTGVGPTDTKLPFQLVPRGSNALFRDDWIYYIGNNGYLFIRWNVGTDAWEFLDLSNTQTYRTSALGFDTMGRLITYHNNTAGSLHTFSAFDLAGVTWTGVRDTGSSSHGFPAAAETWTFAYTNPGFEPNSTTTSGWAILVGDTVYFATWEDASSGYGVRAMSLADGSTELLFLTETSDFGGPVGMVYRPGTPWLPFYANAAESGSPVWFTCCSHAP